VRCVALVDNKTINRFILVIRLLEEREIGGCSEGNLDVALTCDGPEVHIHGRRIAFVVVLVDVSLDYSILSDLPSTTDPAVPWHIRHQDVPVLEVLSNTKLQYGIRTTIY
jgi:hypothetical protein